MSSFRAIFGLPRGPVKFFSWARKFSSLKLTLQRYVISIAVLECFGEIIVVFLIFLSYTDIG